MEIRIQSSQEWNCYILVNLSYNTFESMKNRDWLSGDTKVDKLLYEYKYLWVLKNYVGLFSSNVEDNIDKTRKKLA